MMLGFGLLAVGAAAVAANTWTEVAYGEDAIILAICFTDSNNGFFPFGDSDGTVGMKATNDGGKTWTTNSATKFSSLLMDGTCAGKNGVVGGLFDTQFSNNTWQSWYTPSSKDKFISQSAGTIFGKTDDQFFGLAGSDLAGGNGIATSTDGGNTWGFHNVSVLVTLPRYGSYPSRNVWYISAGMWPSNISSTDADEIALSSRLSVNKKTGKRSLKPLTAAAGAQVDGWIGQIARTSDAGKTWTSLFVDTGNLYFNQIDCGSETNCCASADGATGSYIYCTTDGASWSQKVYVPGASESMMSMTAVGPSEFWAGGGNMDALNFLGIFLHSVDGGNTWTNQTVKSIYVDDMTFGDSTHGWASTLDRNSLSGLASWGY